MADVMGPAWRPRVKPEHDMCRTPDQRIRIGGGVYGIAAEVVDRDGSVWTMLNAADGTRTSAEIVNTVLRRHPAENAESVRTALDRFAQAGYLDDATRPPSMGGHR